MGRPSSLRAGPFFITLSFNNNKSCGGRALDNPLREGFRLGKWEVRPVEGRIIGTEGTVHLEPKVMDVLVCLASNPGHVVEREKILDEVWDRTVFSDEPLTRCIAALRRELGDSLQEPTFIQTVPKRGYRLVSSVQPLHEDTRDKRRLAAAAIAVIALVGLSYLAYQHVIGDSTDAPVLTVEGSTRSEARAYSVAVLPFVNMSKDIEQEYFSDGITEEISSALARTPDLRVTSRTSVFSLKGQNLDIPSIAKRLNVAYIVEGSVRRSGGKLRIVAQLIEADTDRRLWSLTYDRELSEIFAVQDEISRTVVDKLQATLGLKADIAEQLGQEVGVEAYDLFLKGLHAFNIGTVEANLEAEEYFEQAVAIEPTYAAAYYRLARSRLALRRAGRADAVGVLAAASKAIDLNPKLGGAYTVVSLVAPLWNPEKLELRGKALELAPGDSFVVLHYGRALEWNYRKHEADLYFQRAIQLDPLNLEMRTIYGRFNMFRGRAEKALQIFGRVIEANPDYAPAYAEKGRTLAEFEGNLVGGVLALSKAIDLDPEMHQWQLWLASYYLSLGDGDKAKKWIDRVEESKYQRALTDRITATYLHLDGREQQARELATRVFEEHGPGYTDWVLMQLVVRDMIARGAHSEAETFLLEYEPEFPRLLNSPVPTNGAELASRLVRYEWAAMLQHVYRLSGKLKEAEALRARLHFDGMEGRLSYDFEVTSHAYRVEAGRLMRERKLNEALLALRTAVAMGLRERWQLFVRDNPIFDELRGDSGFQEMLSIIEDDMDEQRQRLSTLMAESA